MRIYDVIAKKRDGGTLTEEEINFFVSGVTSGAWADYQSSALLMAICCRGMTQQETAALTMAMANSGERFDLSSIPGIKVDKHSTGGVGDKVTLAVAPICACLGVPIAKMSGRGLGYTGGTVDKLESITGYRVEIGKEEFMANVRENGLCVMAQNADICPADKALYALRDVTGTVESIPLIVSSIMSKKIAAGADKIVLDVKVGSGAFMKDAEQARELAGEMIRIGSACGRQTVAILSDMSTPLGKNIGNALEVQEVLEVLRGGGPADLRNECISVAGMMLKLAERGTLPQCEESAKEAIDSGKAYQKLMELIVRQGGTVQNDVPVLKKEPVYALTLDAWQDGYIGKLDALACGKAGVSLGAGRAKKGDPLNYSAGLVLNRQLGEPVKMGEPIVTLYGRDEAAAKEARALLRQGVEITARQLQRPPHVLAVME